MTTFHPARTADFLRVVQDAPADERRQWEANTGLTWDTDLVVRGMSRTPGAQYAALDAAGNAYVVGGMEPVRSGVIECWMLATETAWRDRYVQITRFCRRLVNQMLDNGIHRVQVYVLASRTDAMRWYETALGMTREGLHRGYFADGSDAISYAKVR